VSRATSANSQLQLLVAEDSEDDFEILLRELRKGGYVVNAARVKSTVELEAALARPWDLLISDWIMPGFGGLQVLQLFLAEPGILFSRARDLLLRHVLSVVRTAGKGCGVCGTLPQPAA